MKEIRQRALYASLIAALVAIVASAVIVAFGDVGSNRGPRPPIPLAAQTPPTLVLNRDLARVPPGSPSRALLAWVSALQFNDSVGVRALISARAATRVSRQDLNAAVAIAGPPFAKPTIVTTDFSGENRARVRAILQTFRVAGHVSSSYPTTFQLVREGGAWKIDDLSLLMKAAHAIERKQSSG